MRMVISATKRGILMVILFAVVYLFVGLVFAVLANSSGSNQMQVTWRLTAYVLSAGAFAANVGYELFRLHNSPRTTALHVSVRVALRAFALAVAANVHAQWAARGYQLSLAIALVAWPAITAVPAFVVALSAGALLSRRKRGKG